jgi:hypothetical protein
LTAIVPAPHRGFSIPGRRHRALQAEQIPALSPIAQPLFLSPPSLYFRTTLPNVTTSSQLLRHLEKRCCPYSKHSGRRPRKYLLPLWAIAQNSNGEVALYIGSTIDLWFRVRAHKSKIRCLNDRFEFYRVVSEKGWTVEWRAFSSVSVQHPPEQIVPSGVSLHHLAAVTNTKAARTPH